MVLTAAVQVLLSRYCGQRDVALGTVTSGRNRTELEQLAGFFVNTLVLRSDVDPEQPFTGFLAEVGRPCWRRSRTTRSRSTSSSRCSRRSGTRAGRR
jgi:non-ribosomal peptide synthetase component F